MELRFLGGTGTVTGSKYLLTVANKKILIDCGLFQGLKTLRLKNWETLPVDPKTIDAVILTHAHIDHSGYLPLLVKNGFSKRIYSTPGTLDLCKILLPDSGHLQEEEARYANKKGFSKHKPALPLYSQKEAEDCLNFFNPVDFEEEFSLGSGITFRFYPAGHILGSAMVLLSAEGKTILFTGDLGRPNDLIMNPPAKIQRTDYLVVESTYGNRRHDPKDPKEDLAAIINRTAKRKGALVVPAFAVGRAQALLYYIHLLKSTDAIPDIPVFLNSPMAINTTNIYCRYRREHRLSPEECEGMCGAAKFVNSAEESKALNNKEGPMVIISASGMATGGRILHHLKAFAPDSKNTILLPGFQAAGTRGAAMAAGVEAIKIHGGMVPVRAEVVKMDSLSAHADYQEILDWLKNFQTAPRQTFITHGEPIPASALREKIESQTGWKCRIPEYLETVTL